MKQYTKLCPTCNEIQIYTSKWGLTCSIKNNISCPDCKAKQREINSGYHDEEGRIYKICPACNTEKMIFNSYEAYKYSFEHSSHCKPCKSREREAKKSIIYSRKCPECSANLFTSNKYWNEIAVREKRICPDCAGKAAATRVVTEETRQKMRENHADVSGKNNPFYGKKHSDEVLKIISEKNTGKCWLSPEDRIKLGEKMTGSGNHFFGKKHTPETRRVIRLKYIERVLDGNGYVPAVGSNEIEYFNLLEQTKKWDGIYAGKCDKQHFLSNLGYYPDYYEPILNIIVEYDEPAHYNALGELHKKDVIRMEEIIKSLHCQFFRYNETTKVLTEYFINE